MNPVAQHMDAFTVNFGHETWAWDCRQKEHWLLLLRKEAKSNMQRYLKVGLTQQCCHVAYSVHFVKTASNE